MRRTVTLGCALAVLWTGGTFITESPAHAGSIARARSKKRIRSATIRAKRKAKRKRAPVRRVFARRGFKQLVCGPECRVPKPAHAWGRTHVVDHLQSILTAFHAKFPEKPAMWVHDLSRRWGGRFWPHKSHRRGTDVDIRVMLDPPSDKYRRATPRTLDLEATWFIVAKLLDTKNVVYIFLDYRLQRALHRYARDNGATEEQLAEFQYPRGRHKREGIIRHAKGHADHLHVRFKSVPTPLTVAMR